MSDEREYWRSAIVGRTKKQQPIYAGELLDELVDLRAQLAEANKRIEALEAVLGFYADKTRYEVTYGRSDWEEGVMQDSGQRARKVLK